MPEYRHEIDTYDIDDIFSGVRNFYKFLYNPIVTHLLRYGGYIAGGCPRHILAKGRFDISDFNVLNHPTLKHVQRSGKEIYMMDAIDVDVFFPDREAYERTRRAIEPFVENMTRSMANFATDVLVRNKDKSTRLKIQLVDFQFMPAKDMLKTFDFQNSMVAFDMNNAYIDRSWRVLEDDKMLSMVNESNNNYIINRLYKYIFKHGYRRITDKTRDILVRYINDHISEFDCTSNYLNFKKCVGGLMDVNVIKDDDLLEFVGHVKYKKNTHIQYGQYVEVDVDVIKEILTEAGSDTVFKI